MNVPIRKYIIAAFAFALILLSANYARKFVVNGYANSIRNQLRITNGSDFASKQELIANLESRMAREMSGVFVFDEKTSTGMVKSPVIGTVNAKLVVVEDKDDGVFRVDSIFVYAD